MSVDVPKASLNKRVPTPTYLQLKTLLANSIRAGEYKTGEALPSERNLAFSFNVSRVTVRKAIQELVEENIIESRRGSGTYVLPNRVEQPLGSLQSFSQEMEALGLQAGSSILETACIPADRAVAKALGVPEQIQVVCITRLRTADDIPLALQVAHLHPRLERFPILDFHRNGSLYETIKAFYGIFPSHAKQSVRTKLPSREESRLLQVKRSSPVLALERTTFDREGVPFEYVRSAYRGDRYQLMVNLYPAPEGSK